MAEMALSDTPIRVLPPRGLMDDADAAEREDAAPAVREEWDDATEPPDTWAGDDAAPEEGDRGPLYAIPAEGAFKKGPYLVDTNLLFVATKLIEEFPQDFAHLANFKVAYMWRKTGGNAGGNERWGSTGKVSGYNMAFTDTAFVIWLAADHGRTHRWTANDVKALLYHQLLHTGQADNGAPAIAPHDAEVFMKEVQHFGFWRRDLDRMSAVVQARLDLENEGASDDDDDGDE